MHSKKDTLFALVFFVFSVLLVFLPNQYEPEEKNAVRCKAKIIEVDNTEIKISGLVKSGDQIVTLEVMNGPFEGSRLKANNPLLGQMGRDKIFSPGETALTVITLDTEGKILFVHPQEHYRIGLEAGLLILLTTALILFCGIVGVKAILSFIFSGLCIWKLMIPMILAGWDPIGVVLFLCSVLCATIIFLVAGLNRTGLVAFSGSFLGILTCCILGWFCTHKGHLHGAIMPFAETLLYCGYQHLDLTKILIASIFLAASGAVMDLAMDVAISMDEVINKKPDISRLEALKSGLRIGRTVVGTMTTTLLLAYSGGYITLMMAFTAQQVPLVNFFNLIYVASEVIKTLVGSFALIMVAPFTALTGAIIYKKGVNKKQIDKREEDRLR